MGAPSSHTSFQPGLADRLEQLLGPGGRLSAGWAGYEHRSGQLEMARAVARAMENHDTALVEAGTGTGKTLAYLLPALLSGLRTVVSTGTKNLQEQIFHKDIPFIRQRLGSGFEAAVLKGRDNYLCLHHFLQMIHNPTLVSARETEYLPRLLAWAKATDTGDRSELLDVPEDFLTWADVSAAGDRCLGNRCPELGDCFLQRARRLAAKAAIVVVNHHLFMADLAVRGGGFGEVIPGYDAVVFDEAHELEDVVTQHFGVEVSQLRIGRLKRDIERELGSVGRLSAALFQNLQAAGHLADTLAREYPAGEDEKELFADDDPKSETLRSIGGRMVVELDALAGRLGDLAKKDEDIESLARRAKTISDELNFILEARDSHFVYWGERRARSVVLRASPIDVAPLLQEHLYASPRPLVFTSATLTTRRSFDYFKERLGLMAEIEGITVPSPFDYQQNAVLYIPRSFPVPGSPDFLGRLVAEVERLLGYSRGRAFVLFTSYRHLNFVSQALAGRLPWPVLVQGEAPRHALLERFKAETSSVLMATSSFWQGVDVPGESLSAVIIDKLPFPRPDRPLIRARSQRLKDEGGDPFLQYHLPEAVISLKQGLGRLIRTRTDRGLLAVLDSRLVTKGYGRMFLDSLPPARRTHRIEDVEAFFEQEMNDKGSSA